MSKQQIQKIGKPWGYELIWAKTSTYVGKVLFIQAGHQLSLQYHQRKEETILVFSGKMNFIFENSTGALEEILLTSGESHHIPPGKKHRMIAIEDCFVFEVSTPEINDVVRIEDAYGRV